MAKVIEDPRDVWPKRTVESVAVATPTLRVSLGRPYNPKLKLSVTFKPYTADKNAKVLIGSLTSDLSKWFCIQTLCASNLSSGSVIMFNARFGSESIDATAIKVQPTDVFTVTLEPHPTVANRVLLTLLRNGSEHSVSEVDTDLVSVGNIFLGFYNSGSALTGFMGELHRCALWDEDGKMIWNLVGRVDENNVCRLYDTLSCTYVDSSMACELTPTSTRPAVPVEDFLMGEANSSTQFLTQDDMNYTYKILDELPDPDKIDTNIVILSKPSKGYAEGQVIVRKFSSTGVPYWSTLDTVTVGVDAPTDIKSFKLEMTETAGGNTYPVTYTHIRWKDPDDKDNATWAYTRLLRKAGSYPTSINDGIVVAQTSRPNDPADKSRDFTFRHPVHDRYPLQISTAWFYKLFAMTKDGVVSTSAECSFSPRLFSWNELSNYIQSGYIKGIWRVGDQFTLTTNDQSVPEFYRNITFTIAGFDNATPVLGDKYRHSVTIVANLMPQIVQNNVPADYFDIAWGTYKLVEDEIYTSGTLYRKSGSTYVAVVPQPSIGTRITADFGYYRIIQNPQRSSGTNRWKDSILRKWLNATQTEHYKLTADETVDDGKTYYELTGDGFYVQVVPESDDNPKNKGWYEVADVPYTTLTDMMPPLMALKAVNPEFYKCIINVRNIQAVPLPFQSEVGSISETTEDKVFIPSITEVFGTSNTDEDETTEVSEGIQLDLFKDQSARIRARYNQQNVPVAWHLRSADLNTPATATGPCKHYLVTADGTPGQSLEVTAAAGITMVLVLG